MKTLFAGVCALAVLAACSPKTEPVATATGAATPTHEEVVARGKYLVEAIGGCNDCHTPMGPQGPDMTKMLAGAEIPFKLVDKMVGAVPWAPVSPAIAGVPAGYTEASLAKLLMDGTPGDGSPARAPMPMYRMNEADATAVAAYLASLPKPE